MAYEPGCWVCGEGSARGGALSTADWALVARKFPHALHVAWHQWRDDFAASRAREYRYGDALTFLRNAKSRPHPDAEEVAVATGLVEQFRRAEWDRRVAAARRARTTTVREPGVDVRGIMCAAMDDLNDLAIHEGTAGLEAFDWSTAEARWRAVAADRSSILAVDSPPSFPDWLDGHLGADGPMGDLARDILWDRLTRCWVGRLPGHLRKHLVSVHAASTDRLDLLSTAADAWLVETGRAVPTR